MPTLDWLNRLAAFTTAAQVPYRLLEQVSVHGQVDVASADNLLPFYRGQVKCIFIDPPYNTKSAFEHYDDNEGHYLKVLMDEVFGRGNFVANVVWEKVYSVKGSAQHLSDMHDHIHVFAKSKGQWIAHRIPRSEKSAALFRNIDNDPRGPWRSGPLAARNHYSLGTYAITCPSGRVPAPRVACLATSSRTAPVSVWRRNLTACWHEQ